MGWYESNFGGSQDKNTGKINRPTTSAPKPSSPTTVSTSGGKSGGSSRTSKAGYLNPTNSLEEYKKELYGNMNQYPDQWGGILSKLSNDYTGNTSGAIDAIGRGEGFVKEARGLGFNNASNALVRHYQDISRQGMQTPQMSLQEIMDMIMGQVAQPAPVSRLSQSEAESRAKAQLEPLFNQYLKDAQSSVEKDLLRRGFFDQLPGAGVTQDTVSRVASEKASKIGELTNSLINQDEASALQKEQLAAQQYQNQINTALQAFGQSQSAEQAQKSQLLNLINMISGDNQAERGFDLQERGLDLQSESNKSQLGNTQFDNLLSMLNATGRISTQEQSDLFGLPVGWQVTTKGGGDGGDWRMPESDKMWGGIVDNIIAGLPKSPQDADIDGAIDTLNFYVSAGLVPPNKAQAVINQLNSKKKGGKSGMGDVRGSGINWGGSDAPITPTSNPIVPSVPSFWDLIFGGNKYEG